MIKLTITDVSCSGFIVCVVHPFLIFSQVVFIVILLFITSTVTSEIPTKEFKVSIIVCDHKVSLG